MLKKIALMLVLVLVINVGVVFADDDEWTIEECRQYFERYLEDDGWDFVGHKGEKLYFALEEKYTKGSLIKTIEFDLATMDLQIRQTYKTFEQNFPIYLAFLSTVMGIKYVQTVNNFNKQVDAKFKEDFGHLPFYEGLDMEMYSKIYKKEEILSLALDTKKQKGIENIIFKALGWIFK